MPDAYVPDYERIVNDITRQIETGQLKPGDKLLSIAQMAVKYDTSKTTVKTAQAILKRLGLIYARRGKATFVATPKPQRDHQA